MTKLFARGVVLLGAGALLAALVLAVVWLAQALVQVLLESPWSMVAAVLILGTLVTVLYLLISLLDWACKASGWDL